MTRVTRIAALFVLTTLAMVMQAQTTLPTLPALNVISDTKTTCTFEAADNTGGLISQCRLIADGTIIENAVYQATEEASLPGTGQVGCIFWKTSDTPAKYRLQCSIYTQNKLVLDGYMPTDIVRKRRWFRFMF